MRSTGRSRRIRITDLARCRQWVASAPMADDLFAAAAQDQLFAATEVNELAWLRLVAKLGDPRVPLSPGHPNPFDADTALPTLRRLAKEEAKPAAMRLQDDAQARHALLPAEGLGRIATGFIRTLAQRLRRGQRERSQSRTTWATWSSTPLRS